MTEEEKQLLPRQKLLTIKYRKLEKKALEDALLETRTRLEKITQTLSDMPRGSSSNDKMTDGIAKMVELENKLNSMLDSLASQEIQVLNNIKKIENDLYRTILYKRHINCDNLLKVALDINYSYEYACSMHGKALNEYDKVSMETS